MNVVPGPTRSVTIALTLICAPVGDLHPDVLAVADAAVVGVLRVDLDEVLLLQLGEPRIGARLVAAAFVFDQAAAGEDQRELLRDLVGDVLLLDALVQRRQPPERLLVVVRRILRHQVGTRRIQRLAVLRNAVGEIPDDGARLRVAERMARRGSSSRRG